MKQRRSVCERYTAKSSLCQINRVIKCRKKKKLFQKLTRCQVHQGTKPVTFQHPHLLQTSLSTQHAVRETQTDRAPVHVNVSGE